MRWRLWMCDGTRAGCGERPREAPHGMRTSGGHVTAVGGASHGWSPRSLLQAGSRHQLTGACVSSEPACERGAAHGLLARGMDQQGRVCSVAAAGQASARGSCSGVSAGAPTVPAACVTLPDPFTARGRLGNGALGPVTRAAHPSCACQGRAAMDRGCPCQPAAPIKESP